MDRIAVLTSGGDAPGMNAALRGVVRSADAAGVTVVGVQDGYEGLLRGALGPFDARSVSGLLHLGGTLLGTARSPRFRDAEGRARAAATLHDAEVDGLVVIGGDGSLAGADLLAVEHDVPVVGVPGTIDNDLAGTDFSLGFDTAVNTALEAIDRIRDTASSHQRLFFIEVMGRQSGWIALYAGLAGGATAVLLPEQPMDVQELNARVHQSFAMGKRFCLVVVAEGVEGSTRDLARAVMGAEEGDEELDHRVTSLGHMQRGGNPTMRDRVLGARLGDGAVAALLDGDSRVMIGEQRNEVIRTPIPDCLTASVAPPQDLLELLDRLAR